METNRRVGPGTPRTALLRTAGMIVPEDWDHLVRNRSGVTARGKVDEGPSKRRKTLVAEDDQARPLCLQTVSSCADVCCSILQSINKGSKPGTANAHEGTDLDLDLDHVLSRVSYRDLLRDMFGNRGDVACPSIPVITRRYEEQYMREPTSSAERRCAMGDECECRMIDRSNPFVGVEFILPGQERPEAPQMCVLCHRRFVQSLFHDVMYAGSEFNGVIQRYGNICGVDGEYAKEVALICPPSGPTHCLPYPAISHQRNRYRVTVVGGVRTVVQCHMSPQDFC